MSKPGLPSGTRDFGPEAMSQRKYVIDCIEQVFRLYGFRAIETPALENLSTLQGKYGDEGDQLLFKVLNNGDFLAKVDGPVLNQKDSRRLIPLISDRGLRYDLTVPLARFIVMNRDKIQFPFKRYQIQPVWRADRPQKGRYREFWQCDADVVGSDSIWNEIDFLKIYDDVFSKLNLPVVIRFNHRKVLDAFGSYLGGTENLHRFMQLIDKCDKIGFDGVLKEMDNSGLEKGKELWQFFYDINALQSNHAKMDALKANVNGDFKLLNEAIGDIETILNLTKTQNRISLDLTLARGLSYYTGTVFEVIPVNRADKSGPAGSLGGGGRYDNLTGVFGLKDVPGVGISFGLDRICDMLEAEELFPDIEKAGVTVLICVMTKEAAEMAFELVNILRNAGISAEIYPGAVKLKKQLDYANVRNIPFAAIIGENEMVEKSVSVKNLKTGVQNSCLLNQTPDYLT